MALLLLRRTMIVYLANKTKFRDDVLSNRIEFNIPQTTGLQRCIYPFGFKADC